MPGKHMDFCKRAIKAGGNAFDLRKQPLKFFACCYAVATRQMSQKVEIEERRRHSPSPLWVYSHGFFSMSFSARIPGCALTYSAKAERASRRWVPG